MSNKSNSAVNKKIIHCQDNEVYLLNVLKQYNKKDKIDPTIVKI